MEDAQASSGEVEVQLPQKDMGSVEGNPEQVIINGDSHEQTKEASKEECDEEAALDGEFIKIEKESIDTKDTSDSDKALPHSAIDISSEKSETSDKNLLEVDGKVKELQHQLETVTKKLQDSESEKTALQSEVDGTKEKLEKIENQCKQLELDSEKYRTQLESLQEILASQEAKHTKLVDLREEAFDRVTADLECSRTKMGELEAQLASSASEVHKFEELCNEKGSHAESESKRALEFEKMLNVSKSNAKEMEDQMVNLMEELKGLYGKIAENQQVQESLSQTSLDLSIVQEKLLHSESQVAELETKLVEQETAIKELTQQLNLHSASEEQVKQHVLDLETLLAASKEDLQDKVTKGEEIETKLQEEVKIKESLETSLKSKETEALKLEEDLIKMAGEKGNLEKNLADLNAKLLQAEDFCSQLEGKLKEAKENFGKTDLLLSQNLSYNKELEEKVQSLEELLRESKAASEMTDQKHLELEDILKTSNVLQEEINAKMRETEIKLIEAEKRNVEIQDQLTLAEVKCMEADREKNALKEKEVELFKLLRELEEESQLSKCHITGYEERINMLESSLHKSNARFSELDLEQKNLAETCAEHEGRADAYHTRNLEIEESLQMSQSKAEEASSKVSELEQLLDAANSRSQGLEQLVNSIEMKCRDAEAESKQYSGRVSELSAELEAFQAKSTSLEVLLQAANEKEKELENILLLVTEERKNFEDLSRSANEKLMQAESLIESLDHENVSSQEKLENAQKDLEALFVREREILGNLRSAEEQLEDQHQAKLLAISENSDALQKTIDELKGKISDYEIKIGQLTSENELLGGTNFKLREELEAHERKVTELSELLSSLQTEKDATAEQLASHVKTIAQLTDEHSRGLELHSAAESRIEEKEGQLKEAIEKINKQDQEARDLHDKLLSLEAELKNYEERVKDSTSVADSHKAELEEALQKLESLEGIFQDIQSKAHHFETENESLARANMNLSQELAAYQTKLNELQMTLNSVSEEKDNTFLQLQSSKKTIEDLMQQLAIDGEKLQSQITFVMEENNTLNTTYQEAKKELEEAVAQLEKQLNDQKHRKNSLLSELEILKVELADKNEVQVRILELEQQLVLAENKFKEELETIQLAADEKEAGLISKLHDNADMLRQRDALNEKLMELQKELDLAHSAMEAQGIEDEKKLMSAESEIHNLKLKLGQMTEMEKTISRLENKLHTETHVPSEQVKDGVSEASSRDGLDTKSRDIALGTSTSTKKKSKKRREGEQTVSNPPSPGTMEPHGAMAFRFVLGVALVSMIIGIILGKRY